MTTYVIVHGATCHGGLMEGIADRLRAKGHTVHTPTTRGNEPGAFEAIGLEEAIQSIVTYLEGNGLTDVVLAGHSWGGMVITGVCDCAPDRIRRLIYWNAFVPHECESLADLCPPHYRGMFQQVADARGDGSFMFPEPVLREVFMNHCTAEQFAAAAPALVPQSIATMTDPIRLSKTPAEFTCGKSHLNALDDTAMPHSHPWHPRMSERLGLFRLVQIDGDHISMISKPEGTVEALEKLGRD